MRPPYLIALAGLLVAGCAEEPGPSLLEAIQKANSRPGCVEACAPYKTTGFAARGEFSCLCSWEPVRDGGQ